MSPSGLTRAASRGRLGHAAGGGGRLPRSPPRAVPQPARAPRQPHRRRVAARALALRGHGRRRVVARQHCVCRRRGRGRRRRRRAQQQRRGRSARQVRAAPMLLVTR